MVHIRRIALTFIAVLGLGYWTFADDLLDDVKPKSKRPDAGGPADDLLDRADSGTRFRLVALDDPEQALDQRIYWRTVEGVVAAAVPPTEFRLGDTEVLAPQASKSGKGETAEPIYPTESLVKLTPGKYQLMPGAIPIEVRPGEILSKHPAVQVTEGKRGTELRILCAPVRLETVDQAGSPTAAPIKVTRDQKSLLRKEVRFNPLILWLPIGGQYDSSFGRFALTADGRIDAKASRLAPGVQITDTGLRRTADGPAEHSTTPSSNLVAVTVTRAGVAKPPVFSLYVPPVISPGKAALFAVSKQEYHRATGEEFSPAALSAQLLLGGAVVPGGKLEVHPLKESAKADMLPPYAAGGASASLHCQERDIEWMAIDLPDALVGPAGVSIASKAFDTTRIEFLVADVADNLQLVPHRWRTAVAENEQLTYQVLIAGPCPGAKAEILCLPVDSPGTDLKSGAPIKLGQIELPEVAGGQHDGRLFNLAASDLPCGKYRIWLESGQQHSGRIPLEVVVWTPKSPFLLQAISCCIPCWPLSESGLALLESFDFQMGAATGHASLLDTRMPNIDAALAARVREVFPGLPDELALTPSANDALLARLLRHRIRLIDLTVARGFNFYNEGLSYHHSYAPSVERVIRRMQVFTQQTGDYPSFWGINHSWFPALQGYVEGGVPTDAHTADRMRVLDEKVRAAGFEPASAEDLKWLAEHRTSDEPGDRQRAAAIAQRATDWWREEQELGFAQHNRLYNAAVRQVRPQTVCTLFENAGHDEGKRSRALFADMNAACYESYTDFGDWPMSTGFAADWARGNTGGQPVWLTVCWGTTPEGTMKSLLHGFVRGIQGGGAPLSGEWDPQEIERRGKGLRFVSQFGSIARDATPERRVALLSRTCRQAVVPRGMYELHAMYYHLTRLGFPPTVVSDDELAATGVPAAVELLVLVQEQISLEPEIAQAIAAFQKRGGKVLSVGGHTIDVAGAVSLPVAVKHLWDLGGFEAGGHAQMWQEFNERWRQPLTAAMQKLELEPLAATDSQQALALTTDAGPVRYVAVIADAAGTHSNDFLRPRKLPVSLAGAGWMVRDLVHQQDIPTTKQDGRTLVSLDLVAEPTVLLALYKKPPEKLAVQHSASPRLGADLVAHTSVAAADGTDLGRVPVSCVLAGPDGKVRRQWFESADNELRVPLAARDMPGAWTLSIQELLTGKTVVATINVKAAESLATARAVDDVHVVDAAHLQAFVTRQQEKLVIVEPGQQALLPVAQRLADALNSAGVPARLWQVAPEQFDTVPLRWYPHTDDQERLRQIAAGELIGFRGNLAAHIDKIKRTHVPELGGYAEINPAYIVGQDCIVFSGGRLAESLRAVSPWLGSPSVPGRGQGRLLVAFSPFMADRQALAVIANDEAGLAKTAEFLAGVAQKGVPKNPRSAPAAKLVAARLASEIRPVAQPYSNFSPAQRSLKLLATADGRSALVLEGQNDNLAFVDAAGKITSTVQIADLAKSQPLQLDQQAKFHAVVQKVLAVDPGWHFPTEVEVDSQSITPDGKLASEQTVYVGHIPSLPPDWQATFVTAPDGQNSVVSRPGSVLVQRPDGAPLVYRDIERAAWRFSLLYPRHAVGSAFSPDSKFVLFTMDSRPPFGGMGSPAYGPTASETVLWDLEHDEVRWRLANTTQFTAAPYAVHSGFAAISRDGKLTAVAGFDGTIYLLDAAGKPILQQAVAAPTAAATGRFGPADGVGVSMSDGGELTAFAFKNLLLLAAGDRLTRVELSGITAATVLTDGSAVIVVLSSGELRTLDASGKQLWTVPGSGPGSIIAAAGKDQLLTANGGGELMLLGAGGHELWRTSVAAAADKAAHPLERAANFVQLPVPGDYIEPNTLELAQAELQAKQIAHWDASGPAKEAWGQKFHPLTQGIELSAGKSENAFVHLVYRRGADNKSLKITTTDTGGKNEFVLDLPTPTYRVIDIPLTGAGAKVVVSADGPAEVAECSLWSFAWPSANLCYIRPAGSQSDARAQAKPAAGADDLDDLLDDSVGTTSGKAVAKTCKLYCPNSDVDRVAGTYLPIPLDPTQIADGRRFESGKLPAWSPLNAAMFPTRGAFFTIDLGKTQPIGLVATYDRSLRQSQVARRIAVFTTEGLDDISTGQVLAGETANDQFWRLFSTGKTKLSGFGVHIFSGPTQTAGLSEVEAYK